MAKIIVKNAVVRKPGYLYYINGNGDVCEALMARGGRKKKSTNKKKKKSVKKVTKKTVKKVVKRKPAKKSVKKKKK